MNSLFKKIIGRYRNIERNKFLNRPKAYKYQYAIVGTGNHTIMNLYPCIWFLGVHIKFICSFHKQNAVLAAKRWADCKGTDQIEDIIDDKLIKGVFVALNPESQPSVIKKLLQAGKHVFVEKPIGFSLQELQDVIEYETHQSICQVGLQRRHAPITSKIKKISSKAIGYKYCFLIGSFPEGNVLYDVFIHPIDYLIHLFGPADISQAYKIKNGEKTTFYLTLSHNGLKGIVELSTNHNWQTPIDELQVETPNEIIYANYPYNLKTETKPHTIFNIPIEKAFKLGVKRSLLLNQNFLPIADNNSLNAMGFYPQLDFFVKTIEHTQKRHNSSLRSLIPTYQVLEGIKKL